MELLETNSKVSPLKIVLLGDSQVGKSCLVHYFIHKQFNYKMVPSKNFDNFVHKFNINDREIWINFVDFSGNEGDPSKIIKAIAGNQIILFLTEYGNPKSFENLKENWFYYATQALGNNFYSWLLCTKVDLLHADNINCHKESQFAEQLGMNFLSISTEKEIKVKGLIENIVMDYFKKIHNIE